jgi:CRP-like cAMP-binding protein
LNHKFHKFSDKNDVLTRLGAGDFFGEIGILNIDGANRRTADVRSVGYSELFSLSKEDVLEGCRDYPEAERKLYEYAQNRLGFEKAKKEAAEKMKSAFSTLTSIASCLTHQITTAPALPAITAKKFDSLILIL